MVPVDDPIVATPVLLLVQMPPLGVELSTVLVATHRASAPDILVGV